MLEIKTNWVYLVKSFNYYQYIMFLNYIQLVFICMDKVYSHEIGKIFIMLI